MHQRFEQMFNSQSSASQPQKSSGLLERSAKDSPNRGVSARASPSNHEPLNQTDRAFITSDERRKCGFGQVTERIGAESQLPFGMCCISLRPAKEPMASPTTGYIYDKSTVVEYLVKERARIKEEMALYEQQEANKKAFEDLKEQQKDAKRAQKFQSTMSELGGQSESSSVSVNKDEAARSVGVSIPWEHKSEARAKSFWAAEEMPEFQKECKKPESLVPRCPMTGKKLRLKDLVPVKFELTNDAKGKDTDYAGMYCCAVSKKPITHQRFDELVKNAEDPRCPVTGKKLDLKKDVIRLQPGGTGFCSHNKVEVSRDAFLRPKGNETGTRALKI